MRAFRKFETDQLKDGEYTGPGGDGVCVAATNVEIRTVSAGACVRHEPETLGDGGAPVLHDQEEVRGEDGKHYQSLVEVGATDNSEVTSKFSEVHNGKSRADNLRGFPSLCQAEPKNRAVGN